jgi:hypothetical protein
MWRKMLRPNSTDCLAGISRPSIRPAMPVSAVLGSRNASQAVVVTYLVDYVG